MTWATGTMTWATGAMTWATGAMTRATGRGYANCQERLLSPNQKPSTASREV